jgi:hypothetical protein
MIAEVQRGEPSFQKYFQENASAEVRTAKNNLLESCRGYLPIETLDEEISQIDRAFDTAFYFHDTNHSEEKRFRGTGEQFMIHPAAVAQIVAGWGLDSITVQAALLHDTLEDTRIDSEFIRSNFGDEVLTAVETETKVTGFPEGAKETLAKLYEALQGDARGVIIKLADRLHNMRTIRGLGFYRQMEKARETLLVYVPLAVRMGMPDIADELKDLAYRALHPNIMNDADRYVQNYQPIIAEMEKGGLVEEFKKSVTSPQGPVRIIQPNAVSFLVEQEGSKLEVRDHQTIQLEIVTGNDSDFDLIIRRLQTFKALPENIEVKGGIVSVDFGYYGGYKIKVNVYNREGRLNASKTILALYQVKNSRDAYFEERKARAIEIQNDLKLILSHFQKGEEGERPKPSDWVGQAREALRKPHLTIFTPKGEKIMIPTDSTVLDFAFRLHTEIGMRAVSVIINGDYDHPKTLDYKLQDGDSVEIVTDESKWTITPYTLDHLTHHHYKSIVKNGLRRIFGMSDEFKGSFPVSDTVKLSEEWQKIVGGKTTGELHKRAEELQEEALERGKARLISYFFKNYHRLYRGLYHKDYVGRPRIKPIADLDKVWDKVPQGIRNKYSNFSDFLVGCGLELISHGNEDEYLRAVIRYETDLPRVTAIFPDKPLVLHRFAGICASASNVLAVEITNNAPGLTPGYSQIEFIFDPAKPHVRSKIERALRTYAQLLDRRQRGERLIFPGVLSDGTYSYRAKLSRKGPFISVLEGLGGAIVGIAKDETTGESIVTYRLTEEDIPPQATRAEDINTLLELMTIISEAKN